MQNVACPMMIVNRPNGTPTSRKVLLSAMPVTMPGSAIGRRTRNDTVSRPKNREREAGHAAIVPSNSATAVAPRPALMLLSSASLAPAACQARDHHDTVKPEGGHPNVRDRLNELTRTTASGR